MDNRQSSFFKMCAAVAVTTEAHSTVWANFAAFATPFAVFKQTLSSVDNAIALQSKESIGTTEQKEQIRQKLSAKLNQLINVLVLYASETNNLPLRRDVYISPSDINKLSEKSLIGHAIKVKSSVPAPIPAAISDSPSNVDIAFITDFENLLNSFTNAIGTPRHIIVESMRGTEELEQHQKTLRDCLERMDIAMEVLQYSQFAFYSEYTNSRTLIDSGTSTRALTVKITDATTNEPVTGAQCTIAPAGIEKLSGEQGIFYVQSLPAGVYTLQTNKAGYQPLSQSFVMDEVGGVQLNIALDKS